MILKNISDVISHTLLICRSKFDVALLILGSEPIYHIWKKHEKVYLSEKRIDASIFGFHCNNPGFKIDFIVR